MFSVTRMEFCSAFPMGVIRTSSVSPDLALSDFHLFELLKKHLEIDISESMPKLSKPSLSGSTTLTLISPMRVSCFGEPMTPILRQP
ncbi:hypothetical protein AVEN_106980-1 [Araneus ventricosus]|uniref:Uncharacterized protein n=1 Tax=Araneus ventricosus TaxID=182803 RepID=A0A4Y2PLW3_ARAVE|nr:hypothetical protein AVEN_106980-1 [Araneus ventricosus]